MNKNISKRSLDVRSMLERLFGRRLLKQTFSQKIVSQKASRKQFSRIKILLALSLMVAVVTGLSMQAIKQNQASAYESTEFVTRWTNLPAGVLAIKLHGNNNGFYLDWGDGQSTVVTNASQISHDYQNPGTYDITIKLLNGAANRFNGWTLQDNRKAEYLTDVLHWGDNLKLSNTSYMFYGAVNLNSFPNISPNTTEEVISMSHMFYAATKFNRSVNFNTSRVMDMSSMFAGAKAFNQSVNFDTSQVTDMSSMFAYAEAFNQSVNFDTSKVTNMSGMFCEARFFNQPINFDTSKVTNMNGMFQDAGNFNKPLNFDTKNVTNMRDMFAGAQAFNQDLSSLDFAAAQTIEHFVSETKLSTKNYDKLLKKWHTQFKDKTVAHKPESAGLKYCTAEAEHDFLKNTKNWQFKDTKECLSAFTTRWTDLPIGKFEIKLHGNDNTFKIDWGDGTLVETKANVNSISHNYATAGTREIKIYASEAGQKFNGWSLSYNSKAKYLTHVLNWGNVKFTNMSYMFEHAEKLNSFPTQAPDTSEVTSMSHMFNSAKAFNQSVNFNTSNVTDMSAMFQGAQAFNQSVNFNTSNVTDMSAMFQGAQAFNQPLNFNTSKVINMSSMFSGAQVFNRPLNNFDTSKVTNMSYMFNGAQAFNQSVNFDTSKVTNMSDMFCNATVFNQPLNNFNTSKVTNMSFMFYDTKAFNQPLNFNTSKVTNMSYMFSGATAFNQSVNFDTSNVTDMSYMFQWAQVFNQPVNFNTSNVTNMSTMFRGARAFNQSINFDTSKVTNMSAMFQGAQVFNQPVNFNTSKVTNMSDMFYGAQVFNQDLSSLDFAAAQKIDHFVSHSKLSIKNYDKLLKKWHIQFKDKTIAHKPQSTGLKYCAAEAEHDYLKNTKNWTFNDSKQCPPAFTTRWTNLPAGKFEIKLHGNDNTFKIDWGDGTVETKTNVNKISHNYTSAGTREIKIYASEAGQKFNGWILNDDYVYPGRPGYNLSSQYLTHVLDWGNIAFTNMHGMFASAIKLSSLPSSAPNTSQVTDMSCMFNYTPAFNQPVNFDTRNVTDMHSMFANTTIFNQPLNFDTRNVTDMNAMFFDAKAFNQPLNFDTSKVTNMSHMFRNAKNFNKPISFDTKNVIDMSYMFFNTAIFNQPLNFDTRNVTNMLNMFSNAAAFNQPLNFNTSKVTNMAQMFHNAENFNKPLNFDTKSVIHMSGMFHNATAFNQPVNFDTKSVTNMSYMFFNAAAFNQPVNFDTRNVTDMSGMFHGAQAFNQPVNFNTSRVANMSYMFFNTTAFNQDLSSLDFAAARAIENFVSLSKLSVENYDKLLKKWHTQLKDNPITYKPTSNNLKYCFAETEHNYLKNTKNWKFNDSKDCSEYNLAPADITISNNQVNENNAPNFELADITITNDPNDIPNDTNTASLTCATADADDASFQIVGNKLILKPSADFETKNKYNICIRAIDSFGKGKDKNFTIDVRDLNEAPTIANQTFTIAENSANGTELGQVVATDPDAGQTLTYQIVSGNDLGIFEITADGKLKVKDNTKLDYEQRQSVTLRVKATDNGTPALHAEADITINITDVNEAPSWTSADQITINEDETAEHTLAATDPENNPLTYSADNLPSWVALTNNKLTFNPTQSAVGNHNIKLKVSDGTNQTTQTFKVTVNNVNDAPVWTSANTITMNEKATLEHNLTATDEDGDSLTYSADNLPSWITLANNKLTLKPRASEIGTHTITVKVSDGTVTVPQTITITVNNVNDAPVITSAPNETATKGEQYSYTITATDEDSDPLTFAVTAKPDWLTFDTTTHTLSGTPGNSEVGQTYSITLTVSDGTNQTTQTFNLTVNDKNYAPTIANQTFSVAENSANGTELGQVVATDPDAGQSLTYEIVSGNDLGIFEITNDGKLKVKDNTNLDYEQHQSVTLRVKVTDNGTPTLSAEADITINITDVDDEAPTITVDGGIAPREITVGDTFNAPSATCHDNQGNCTLTVANSVDTTTAGDYQVTYTAIDEAGNRTVVTIAVKVKAPTPPVQPGNQGSQTNQGNQGNQGGQSGSSTNQGGQSNQQTGQTNNNGNSDNDPTASTDNNKPPFTINGQPEMTINQGDEYVEPGVTCAPGTSCSVEITGKVNSKVPGTYTITYKTTDANGKVTTVTRKITVRGTNDKTTSANANVIEKKTFGAKLKQIYAKYLFWWWWLILLIIAYRLYRRWQKQRQSRNATSSRRSRR